ncbi:LysM peptidoglycan-binding domain-containing protein [Bacillus massiliigorillae]|uniref:LysM peptidoglycan-binding domain-containing protein n=1 Tax=Bacillus massiliigorillae TaxID=1243664 RepID=UPI000399AEE5|nr:LysM peptidoglycan-binding domain-containing protein [Bacillus massiliigorillae]
MTNQEHKDQAELLRKKVDSNHSEAEFSVDSLPSRKEVHSKKKQKTVWKIKFPLVKLLAAFFVLLPVAIFAFYTYFTKDDKPTYTKEKDESSFSSEVNVDDKYVVGSEKKEDSSKDKDSKDKASKEKESKEKQLASANEQKESEKDAKKEIPSTSASSSSGPNVKSEEPTSNNNKNNNNNNTTHQVPVKNEPKEPEKKPVVPNQNESTPKVIEHTVKPKETIFRIAMNYYKSQSGIDIIKRANGLTSNDIRVGQVLKIPMD